MDFYRTIYKEGAGEIVEKKSRFIAEAYPVAGEEEAFAHLEEVKKRYWDARHHCWAYVTGRNPGQERMSDDGEPAGTAGKPILEVIRGRELTDIFIVVTRYFGGTLLGTGGLVRAYTSAAAEALAHTEIITRIHGLKLKVTTDYTGLGKDPVYSGAERARGAGHLIHRPCGAHRARPGRGKGCAEESAHGRDQRSGADGRTGKLLVRGDSGWASAGLR